MIRHANAADIEGIRTLYEHLHPAEPMLPVDQIHKSWTAMLANPWLHCLVAQVGTQLVATCALLVIPNLTRSARPYGLVENVVTHQAHRKMGFGTAVLRAALDIARKEGCYKVMLMTGSRREETWRFYEAVGFSRGTKTAFVAYPV